MTWDTEKKSKYKVTCYSINYLDPCGALALLVCSHLLLLTVRIL